MNPLRCLIVEDEPLAAEILEGYLQEVPHLVWVKSCSDAIAAMEVLREDSIDVLFLDIHLPRLKGLDFLRSLRNPPSVILTTAYHQYAVEAFELEVVDYLMKPISFVRFLQAVEKLPSPLPLHQSKPETDPFRFFSVGKQKVKVQLRSIQWAESHKEYLTIYAGAQQLTTKYSLTELAKELAPLGMVRIHRSYAVSKAHIQAFSATEIQVAGKWLPIGRSYQEAAKLMLAAL
jgi:DNA-binding LytR/AlgR family response regulator